MEKWRDCSIAAFFIDFGIYFSNPNFFDNTWRCRNKSVLFQMKAPRHFSWKINLKRLFFSQLKEVGSIWLCYCGREGWRIVVCYWEDHPTVPRGALHSSSLLHYQKDILHHRLIFFHLSLIFLFQQAKYNCAIFWTLRIMKSELERVPK